jgi:hypothetical protein
MHFSSLFAKPSNRPSIAFTKITNSFNVFNPSQDYQISMSNVNQFSEIDNISNRLKSQGYQLGIEESDEQLLQANFNVGFVQGAPMRFKDGYIRGLTTGKLLAEMLMTNAFKEEKLPTSPTPYAISNKLPNSIENEDVPFGSFSKQLQPATSGQALPKSQSTVSRTFTFLTDVHKNIGNDSSPLLLLLLLLTIRSKQLSNKPPLAPPPASPSDDFYLGDYINNAAEEAVGNITLFSKVNSLQALIDWINALPGGQWGAIFAKIDPQGAQSIKWPTVDDGSAYFHNDEVNPSLIREHCRALLASFYTATQTIIDTNILSSPAPHFKHAAQLDFTVSHLIATTLPLHFPLLKEIQDEQQLYSLCAPMYQHFVDVAAKLNKTTIGQAETDLQTLVDQAPNLPHPTTNTTFEGADDFFM